MDYSDLHETIVRMAEAQGVNKSFIEKPETLYYDESGNVKHLIVKGGGLNADSSLVFVLGGIQAENTISLDDLKKHLGKTSINELKANRDLKGDFYSILRKENFRLILQLLVDKNWHIHFFANQILYYGFVDIVDSINGLEPDPFEFKALLYEVLKTNPNATIDHFKKYKYPNIKNGEKGAFIDGILDMIDARISENANRLISSPLMFYMRSCFEKAKSQKCLHFIQDEEPHVWVSEFVQFYRNEIMTFCRKKLIFDEEKQVQKLLIEENITFLGNLLNNYAFLPSDTNAMIQISDYVVSILRKYIMFLDRDEPSVEKDIHSFDETQMDNFTLLNKVLSKSLDYNPMFVHFTASIHVVSKYHKYLKEFGYI